MLEALGNLISGAFGNTGFYLSALLILFGIVIIVITLLLGKRKRGKNEE